MPIAPPFLLQPQHVHAGVNSPQEYRRRQAEAIANGRALYANLIWKDPWLNPATLPVFVSAGKILVECACGNCPSVSEAWGGLACCWDCGAIYEGLQMPPELRAIEQALICRLQIGTRYWAPGTAVRDLWVQNVVAGWIALDDERLPADVREQLQPKPEPAAEGEAAAEETITVEAVQPAREDE